MKHVVTVRGSAAHWGADESRPYEEALRAAGIEPAILSPDDAAPHDWSGLLLMGGSDVNPATYGEPRREETDPPDDARDQLECALIAEAIARDVPVLAICRGAQMLNVQQGGTLVQHLDAVARHRRRDPQNLGAPAHGIAVTPGSLLARIADGAPIVEVNSRHHQAIGRVGEGLRVSARDCEDGTIEAVERPDSRFVLGVQWHPENMSAADARQAALFRAFADAIKQA